MTSDSIFPRRFTLIDELIRRDHWYLADDDICYFLGEYTAREGYAFSPTNQLIVNFKKPMDRQERPEWYYRQRAILQAATAFRVALDDRDLDSITFVPIPPSKAKSDPLYNDRLIRMLHAIRAEPPLDIRELIVQTRSVPAVHESETRLTPLELQAIYEVDLRLTEPTPSEIAIVDDVLTAGAHFKAVKAILEGTFPGVRIIGLFLARRVPETVDIESFEAQRDPE